MKRIYPCSTEQDGMFYAYADGTPATESEWLDYCRQLEEERAEVEKMFGTSRVIREVYEDCDLHRALINMGYEVRRENFYFNGRYTGKVKDFYVPTKEGKQFPGCVRDYSAEPRYIVGRGGNAYPAEFLEMYPYTFGRH